MTALNDLVLYRSATSRYQGAVIVHIESGDTCRLLVLGDGADWEDSVSSAFNARQMGSIAKGTSVGQWQEIAGVSAATSAAIASALEGYASEGYVDASVSGLASTSAVTAAIASSVSGLASSSAVTSAIAAAVAGLATTSGVTSAISAATSGLASTSGVASAISSAVSGLATSSSVTGAIATAEAYADSLVSGLAAEPGAGVAQTVSLGSARQPSTAHATRVTISGTVAMTSTLLGGQNATVNLLCDASNPPTTIVGVQGPMTLSGVAATTTHPWCLTYDVPVNYYYKVDPQSVSANATVAVTHINETAI